MYIVLNCGRKMFGVGWISCKNAIIIRDIDHILLFSFSISETKSANICVIVVDQENMKCIVFLSGYSLQFYADCRVRHFEWHKASAVAALEWFHTM